MEIARLTEYIIEYLLISSVLLFLLGILSFFAVSLFRIKGKTKIWIYALIFILPVVYPLRSILPESIKFSVPLRSEYLKPLTEIAALKADTHLTSLSQVNTLLKDNAASKADDFFIEKSSSSFKEEAADTAPILTTILFANWKLIVAVIWLILFIVLFIRLILASRAIKRLLCVSTPVTDQRYIELLRQCALDTGLTRVPLLYVAQGNFTPMSTGFIRPVIVLPSHLLADESIEGLRFTLLHELKHIDQHHNLWLMIEAIIGAIYFFHPIIHWAKRRIHEEMEHVCDEHFIKVTHKSVTYADFLLNEIWQNNSCRYPAFSLPFISSASKTAERIRTILDNRVASASIPAREAIVVASVFILFSCFIFFTVSLSVQGPKKVASPITIFETVDRGTSPVLPVGIENIKVSSINTILTSTAENNAKEKNDTVVPGMNTETTDKRKYINEKPYGNLETATVENTISKNDNPDIETVIQPQGLHTYQTGKIMDDQRDISVNISRLDNNRVKETLKETLETPAETSAKKYLGAPVNALTINRIDNILVLDQYTILFIMRGRDMYLTRMKEPCPALLYANDFNLLSTTGTISKFDRIQAISDNQVMGTTGMLGEFYSYRYEGNKGEAIKNLKKLVSEGALNPT